MLDLLKACERFTAILFDSKNLAYLEVSRLAQLASEKSEQEWVFQLLTFFLSKNYDKRETLSYLEAIYQAKKMWFSNVSFQNALEYMVIT
mgnify:FL=1